MMQLPLGDDDRRTMFDEWCEKNPRAWQYIRNTALGYWRRGLSRISTKFLVEKCRYDWPHKTVGIPFVDQNGRTHVYNINNNDTAVMARVLLEEFPDMPIETRRRDEEIREGAACQRRQACTAKKKSA